MGKPKEMLERIYVFDNGRGVVKIGRSRQVERRKRTLETQSGANAIKFYCTPPCSNGSEIEKECHKIFCDFRVCGEWFCCSFEDAKNIAKQVFYRLGKQEEESEEERSQKDQNMKKFFDEVCGLYQNGFFQYNMLPLSERLDFDRWNPTKDDEEDALKLLLNDYKADLEITDGDYAQEYIALYNAIKKDGLLSHKKEFQEHIASYYYAVEGDYIERYGRDSDISTWIEKTIIRK